MSMTDLLWCATLKGPPRTKKNHQRILNGFGGRPFVVPSKEFVDCQELCLRQIKTPQMAISEAVNVKAVYYMPNCRRVDLVNLLEATDDIILLGGPGSEHPFALAKNKEGRTGDFNIAFDKEKQRFLEVTP